MVVINFWMFFTGHELYQDSPATIFIVALNAIMFVLPGLLIYFLIFLDRKRWLATIWPTANAPVDGDPSMLDSHAQNAPKPHTPHRP